MSDTEQQPRNRKERRLASKQSGKPISAPTKVPHRNPNKVPSDYTTSIPMAQPDRSGPKGKTLYEIADERMAALQSKGQPFASQHSDGRARDEDGNVLFPSSSQFSTLPAGSDESPIGALGEAVFLTITLSMIHFTLDVLVYQQYRQEIEWWEIVARSAKVMPVLLVLIYLLHTGTAKRFHIARMVFFAVVCVAAGCYMVYAGNTYDYFAVMKRAPPLGALWVWSVVEMGLGWAVGSLSVVGAFLWWNGYGIF